MGGTQTRPVCVAESLAAVSIRAPASHTARSTASLSNASRPCASPVPRNAIRGPAGAKINSIVGSADAKTGVYAIFNARAGGLASLFLLVTVAGAAATASMSSLAAHRCHDVAEAMPCRNCPSTGVIAMGNLGLLVGISCCVARHPLGCPRMR